MAEIAARTIAQIVTDAGGTLTGRTRLQKIAYLLSVTGLEDTGRFFYKHYGPYSESLEKAVREAEAAGLVQEEKMKSNWGALYSIFRVLLPDAVPSDNQNRVRLVTMAAQASVIELELAATALFLALEGNARAWQETADRKPEKADAGRLARARELYGRLAEIPVERPLPQIDL